MMRSPARKWWLVSSLTLVVAVVVWFTFGGDLQRLFHGRAQSAASQAGGRSVAERLVDIRRLIELDRARQVELEALLKRLDQEFESSSESFSRIDRETSDPAQPQVSGTAKNPTTSEVTPALEAERSQQRDRLDQIIRHRKVIRRQLEVLQDKLAVARSALDRMTNTTPEARPTSTGTSQSNLSNPVVVQSKPVASGTSPIPAATAPSVRGSVSSTLIPGLPTSVRSSSAEGSAAAEPVVDERLIDARKDRAAKEAAVEAAKSSLLLRDQAATVFERDLDVGTELLGIANEESVRLSGLATASQSNLAERRKAGASAAEVATLEREVSLATADAETARREVVKQTERLQDTKEVLAYLKEGRAPLEDRLEAASSELEAADRRLRFLESPLAPSHIFRWFLRTVPRIAIICAIVAVCWWLTKMLAARVVTAVIRRRRHTLDPEREGRAETLRRVFQSTAGTAVLVLGGLALLDQAGLDVTVLLGGAAVIGAAVAFGSQNLIKDFFSGFMILIENQYSVGHVITLGGISGQVEDITLRMTALRDEAGTVHFIPHGQVTTVSNMTHGWSRAVIALRVSYEQDVDRVIGALRELMEEFTRDEFFKPNLIDKPEMQGVDSLEDSAVVVKFLLKTRPMTQWNVKREALRRIKNRFDELGIEIPLPQREIHVTNDDEERFSGGRDARSHDNSASRK